MLRSFIDSRHWLFAIAAAYADFFAFITLSLMLPTFPHFRHFFDTPTLPTLLDAAVLIRCHV
jgi:hypothetical protein